MHSSYALSLVDEKLKAIRVIFDGKKDYGDFVGKEYFYLTYENAKVGDLFITPSPYTHTGYAIVQVNGVLSNEEIDDNREYKFAIQKIDLDAHKVNVSKLKAVQKAIKVNYKEHARKTLLTSMTPEAKKLLQIEES